MPLMVLIMLPMQAITVTVKNVHNPRDYDAVGLLVPYNANRKVIPPQKIQWLIKGSAGMSYLTTGSSSVTCVIWWMAILSICGVSLSELWLL